MDNYHVVLQGGEMLSGCHLERQQRSRHRGISSLIMFVGVRLAVVQESASALHKAQAAVATAIVAIHTATRRMRTTWTYISQQHLNVQCKPHLYELQGNLIKSSC